MSGRFLGNLPFLDVQCPLSHRLCGCRSLRLVARSTAQLHVPALLPNTGAVYAVHRPNYLLPLSACSSKGAPMEGLFILSFFVISRPFFGCG